MNDFFCIKNYGDAIMSDNHSKEIRSMNMSNIRSKNTKPEEIVRKYLFSRGLRYRKNVRSLPGCPDIVLPKYKTIVLINGCFWHHHDCGRFVWPSSNEEYWKKKINGNIERDYENLKRSLFQRLNACSNYMGMSIKKKLSEKKILQLYIIIYASYNKNPAI
jgi:DNA mismatch endonuclease (patch repair protein)